MKIDCLNIHTPQALHEALARCLQFPDWYGHNLDALYDCLTDLEEEAFLTLLHFPAWAEDFRQVFQEAMEANECLHIMTP